jgi:hypothetical protein
LKALVDISLDAGDLSFLGCRESGNPIGAGGE